MYLKLPDLAASLSSKLRVNCTIAISGVYQLSELIKHTKEELNNNAGECVNCFVLKLSSHLQ